MTAPETLYLNLLKKSLTRAIDARDVELHAEGKEFPALGETMIGLKRLESLQQCVDTVLRDGVPGDFAETGVWRGGASIFMRGMLAFRGIQDRLVWVMDSFQGLPAPDVERYPADAAALEWEMFPSDLVVPLEQVKTYFWHYGLLDDQVHFVPGWFRDTLPTVPVERLALLRLDGDMYESTILALEHLYPKLSVGGYLIVDDYGFVEPCRRAVDDYRRANGIAEPIVPIDWTGVLWRRES